MENYYSKEEYRVLERKVKNLIKENEKLKNKIKELKRDYDILLETASEK